MAAQLLQHRRLQLSCRHTGQARCTGVLLDVALGHVVAVAATVLFGCLKRRHRATVTAKDDAFEQVLRLSSGRGGPHPAIGAKNGMGIIPTGLRDDRRVLRLIPKLLVAQFAKVSAIVQDLVNQPLVDGLVQARNIVDALKSVGIDGTNLASREDFRLLVETRDVNSQQGQEQLLKLLDLGPQFAQLSDYMKANDVTMKQLVDAAPQVELLNKMLTPAEQTAKSTGDLASTAKVGNTLLSDLNESVRAGTNSTTSAINVLAGAVNGMAAVAEAAVSAAQSAAASAAAASSAASSAADKVSLVQSQPTYIYDIGGAKP